MWNGHGLAVYQVNYKERWGSLVVGIRVNSYFSSDKTHGQYSQSLKVSFYHLRLLCPVIVVYAATA
jgi:hypothetical protein